MMSLDSEIRQMHRYSDLDPRRKELLLSVKLFMNSHCKVRGCRERAPKPRCERRVRPCNRPFTSLADPPRNDLCRVHRILRTGGSKSLIRGLPNAASRGSDLGGGMKKSTKILTNSTKALGKRVAKYFDQD